MPRPLAVLDANVLYPFQIRNLLLHIGEFGAFDPLWSETIVSEFSRHLLGSGVVTEDQLDYLISQMRRYFPDAWGRHFDGRAGGLDLPDEDDRHVVALAIHYEAEFSDEAPAVPGGLPRGPRSFARARTDHGAPQGSRIPGTGAPGDRRAGAVTCRLSMRPVPRVVSARFAVVIAPSATTAPAPEAPAPGRSGRAGTRT